MNAQRFGQILKYSDVVLSWWPSRDALMTVATMYPGCGDAVHLGPATDGAASPLLAYFDAAAFDARPSDGRLGVEWVPLPAAAAVC